MAEEKRKLNKYQITPEVPRTKGSHRKQETVCSDKRRQHGYCGICGSPDIVSHGIEVCCYCEWESEYNIWEGESWRWSSGISNKHDCPKKQFWIKRYSVSVCVACGASTGPLCPNCKKQHWYHWQSKKHFCRSCGYRV